MFGTVCVLDYSLVAEIITKIQVRLILVRHTHFSTRIHVPVLETGAAHR